MTQLKPTIVAPGVAGEAYGVRVLIGGETDDLLARMVERVPPGWQPTKLKEGDSRFLLSTPNGITYDLRCDGQLVTNAELEVALGVFESHLRGHIAFHAPSRIFVHAGVVGHGGRAIVIPGPSFSGKTTLVAELVRSGATYYSDEYAVLDEQGLVHPYPKPLSIRLMEGSGVQTDHPVSSIGGIEGVEPLPIGIVVSAQYRSGETWEPEELTSGNAVLELLANTVPARERPEQSLAVLKQALNGATAYRGVRGQASETVRQILDGVRA